MLRWALFSPPGSPVYSHSSSQPGPPTTSGPAFSGADSRVVRANEGLLVSAADPRAAPAVSPRWSRLTVSCGGLGEFRAVGRGDHRPAVRAGEPGRVRRRQWIHGPVRGRLFFVRCGIGACDNSAEDVAPPQRPDNRPGGGTYATRTTGLVRPKPVANPSSTPVPVPAADMPGEPVPAEDLARRGSAAASSGRQVSRRLCARRR